MWKFSSTDIQLCISLVQVLIVKIVLIQDVQHGCLIMHFDTRRSGDFKKATFIISRIFKTKLNIKK